MKNNKANKANANTLTSNNSSNKNNTTDMKNNSNSINNIPAKRFEYIQSLVNPADLQIHPLLNVIGYKLPDELFNDFVKEFNYLERPVVTEDGFVITHPTDVIAAQQQLLGEIEIVTIKNACQDDVIRFISYKNIWEHGKNRTALYGLINVLKDHLTNTVAGKIWAQDFGINNTRQMIAEIIGVSDGTIHNISTIGDKNPELLAKIDNREITNSEAIQILRNESPIDSKKRFENQILCNIPAQQPKYKINSLTLDIAELGELKLNISGVTATGSLDGNTIDLIHTVEADNISEKQQEKQHHILQASNAGYSIQLILRDFTVLGKEIGLGQQLLKAA